MSSTENFNAREFVIQCLKSGNSSALKAEYETEVMEMCKRCIRKMAHPSGMDVYILNLIMCGHIAELKAEYFEDMISICVREKFGSRKRVQKDEDGLTPK